MKSEFYGNCLCACGGQDLLDFVEDLDEEAVYRSPMYRILEDAFYAGKPDVGERSDSEAEQANDDDNNALKSKIASGVPEVDGSLRRHCLF